MDPDVEPYIPISALNAYLYCPHRLYREHVLHEWADNAFTVDAAFLHRHVDEPGRRGPQTTRIWVKSERLRLVGIVDVVEEAGELVPVEYKRGRGGPWLNDAVQVCAQAMCLEEQTGRPVGHGYIWYARSRRRRRVAFDAVLRRRVEETVHAVRAVLAGEVVPPNAYGPRCDGCSLLPICLPVESAFLRRLGPEALEGA